MSLDDRVMQFQCLELPGQPMMMHMGTSYLVHDLYSEVKRLRAELESRTLPEGMALVPREITAETGHKAGMIGDFHETIALDCLHCEAEGCNECHGTGQHRQYIPVTWTTIKAIHRRIVEIAEPTE